MINKFFNNPSFILVSLLLILSIIPSIWLLQDHGPWDFYVFLFISLPINIILLIILFFNYKNIDKTNFQIKNFD